MHYSWLRSVGYCPTTFTVTSLVQQSELLDALAPGRELGVSHPPASATMVEENRWTKKRKAEEEAAAFPTANVIVQFQSDDGVAAGTSCPHLSCSFVTARMSENHSSQAYTLRRA